MVLLTELKVDEGMVGRRERVERIWMVCSDEREGRKIREMAGRREQE